MVITAPRVRSRWFESPLLTKHTRVAQLAERLEDKRFSGRKQAAIIIIRFHSKEEVGGSSPSARANKKEVDK